MTIGAGQQRPDRLGDRLGVRVDAQSLPWRTMPRHMQIADARAGHRGDEGLGVIAVVHRIHVDVVDVQQQVAIGLFQNLEQKIALGQLGAERQIIGRILDGDAPAEHILHLPDPLGDIANHRRREGQRHQVVELRAIGGGSEMIAEAQHPMRIEKLAQLMQEARIQRIGAPEREGEPVRDQRVVPADLGQALAEPTAKTDPVLRCQLQEIQGGPLCQQLIEQRPTQSEAGPGRDGGGVSGRHRDARRCIG